MKATAIILGALLAFAGAQTLPQPISSQVVIGIVMPKVDAKVTAQRDIGKVNFSNLKNLALMEGVSCKSYEQWSWAGSSSVAHEQLVRDLRAALARLGWSVVKLDSLGLMHLRNSKGDRVIGFWVHIPFKRSILQWCR